MEIGLLLPLADATASRCGGKATTLALLMRAGFPVPDGFVLPADAPSPDLLILERRLAALGAAQVAVRSSALDEDSTYASAAGQYASVIGVRTVSEVATAIARCRASAHSERIVAYRDQLGRQAPAGAPAILIQRLIDADVAGVMFTAHRGSPTRIEAVAGLGIGVVEGTVTPQVIEVASGRGPEVGGGPGPLGQREAHRLSALGARITRLLGAPQDVEWAIDGDRIWILQSRRITAPLPADRYRPGCLPAQHALPTTLIGTPGSRGIATAPVRVALGPPSNASVRPGEVLVCHHTDPAWTPLFGIAAGIVTVVGGVLSHAAIVAREYGIPAVIGVPHATTLLRDGDVVTIDGSAGTVDPR